MKQAIWIMVLVGMVACENGISPTTTLAPVSTLVQSDQSLEDGELSAMEVEAFALDSVNEFHRIEGLAQVSSCTWVGQLSGRSYFVDGDALMQVGRAKGKLYPASGTFALYALWYPVNLTDRPKKATLVIATCT